MIFGAVVGLIALWHRAGRHARIPAIDVQVEVAGALGELTDPARVWPEVAAPRRGQGYAPARLDGVRDSDIPGDAGASALSTELVPALVGIRRRCRWVDI